MSKDNIKIHSRVAMLAQQASTAFGGYIRQALAKATKATLRLVENQAVASAAKSHRVYGVMPLRFQRKAVASTA